VAIGTTRDELERIKGKASPVRSLFPEEPRGFPDPEFLDLQELRKRVIVAALPDPAPKQDVLKALEALAAVDREPVQYTTAVVYNGGTENFVRYDVGRSGTVRLILAESCVVK
jgi:hypothetical protein